MATIITSVDTVCLGDSIAVQGAWERIVRIDNPRFNSDIVGDNNTILHTVEGNMIFVSPGAMVEVQ